MGCVSSIDREDRGNDNDDDVLDLFEADEECKSFWFSSSVSLLLERNNDVIDAIDAKLVVWARKFLDTSERDLLSTRDRDRLRKSAFRIEFSAYLR